MLRLTRENLAQSTTMADQAGRRGSMGVQVGSMGVQVGFAGRLRKLPWLRSRATSGSSTHSCRSTSRRARQESQAHYRSISALEHIEQCGGMGSIPPWPGTPPSASDSRRADALVTGIFDATPEAAPEAPGQPQPGGRSRKEQCRAAGAHATARGQAADQLITWPSHAGRMPGGAGGEFAATTARARGERVPGAQSAWTGGGHPAPGARPGFQPAIARPGPGCPRSAQWRAGLRGSAHRGPARGPPRPG